MTPMEAMLNVDRRAAALAWHAHFATKVRMSIDRLWMESRKDVRRHLLCVARMDAGMARYYWEKARQA